MNSWCRNHTGYIFTFRIHTYISYRKWYVGWGGEGEWVKVYVNQTFHQTKNRIFSGLSLEMKFKTARMKCFLVILRKSAKGINGWKVCVCAKKYNTYWDCMLRFVAAKIMNSVTRTVEMGLRCQVNYLEEHFHRLCFVISWTDEGKLKTRKKCISRITLYPRIIRRFSGDFFFIYVYYVRYSVWLDWCLPLNPLHCKYFTFEKELGRRVTLEYH